MSKIKDIITRALRAQLEYLSRYRAGHTTLGCRITHMIGVPMIMASLLAFTLYAIPALQVTAILLKHALFSPTLATVMFILRVGLPSVLVDVLTTPGAVTNLMSGIVLFTVGWLLQFIGHIAFEKNSPLFLTNPFNPLSYSTAVIFIAEEFGKVITRPFSSLLKK